jgi:hypothetical protein
MAIWKIALVTCGGIGRDKMEGNMSEITANQFTRYRVFYTPAGAAAQIGIRLDDGSREDNASIAGYLVFWERPIERLPEDEQSPDSGYIVKNMLVSRANSVLDLLHRQIDLLKRPMVISCAVDGSGTLRTWLGTTSSSERNEIEPFFTNFPSISFLNPDTVNRDWEGTVEIHGSNFDSGSFAFFDGMNPKTIYKSDSLLEVEVKKDITGTTGTKKVKVHTGSGSLSNEVDFVVK